MRKLKTIIVLVALMLTSQLLVLAQSTPRWENLCKGSANPYCVAVGRDAYNDDSRPIPLRGLKLGKIIGVVWLAAGQTVSGRGESVKVAPRNAYYYIIDDRISEPFLKLIGEVEVKYDEEETGFSKP